MQSEEIARVVLLFHAHQPFIVVPIGGPHAFGFVCAQVIDIDATRRERLLSDTRAAGDQGRPLVDHAIPDFTGVLVPLVCRTDKGTTQACLQRLDHGLVQQRLGTSQCRTV
jgi:hypothetical protein